MSKIPPNDPSSVPGMVSVVVIFLNAEQFIKETIESVVTQTYTNWELLLIDDGSSDASTGIAKKYAEQFPGQVRYIEHSDHRNHGKSASRNLGVVSAKGEYLAFLDADDVYLPQKLERQVDLLVRFPQAAMVYGSTFRWYGWTGKSEDIKRDWASPLGITPNQLVEPPHLMTLYFQDGNCVPCTCGWTARKSVIDPKGGSETDFKDLYEDQVFLAKIVLNYPVYVEDGSWDKYRQHPGMTSSQEFTGTWSKQPRSIYVHWLANYIRQNGIKDAALEAGLKKELDEVFILDHPKLFQFIHSNSFRPLKTLLQKMIPSSVVDSLKRLV